VPVGTAFHERTLALCESLNYREWSGYYTVGAYEMTHEHEYNAIRNSAALIDISPLFKYRVTGGDATKFVNRVITRDINKVAVDQVIYCCWCDPEGKVVDDGTITRLGENEYRWTAADPSLRWFSQNSLGLNVEIEDISEKVAALALQGPTSGRLLHAVADANIAGLKYFRVTHGKIAGVPVDISRTGYTGDLGYEIWVPCKDAIKVFDALMDKGRAFDIHPAGMVALDIARIEAGLILIEVDYISSKKSLIDEQRYTPGEIGLGKLVDLKKESFVGREALMMEAKKGGSARRLVGLEVNWNEVEAPLRKDWDGAAGAVDGFAGGCAGVSRGAAGGEGNVDDVVADFEEDDCAGYGGTGERGAGDEFEHGIDSGGFAEDGVGEGGGAAVF